MSVPNMSDGAKQNLITIVISVSSLAVGYGFLQANVERTSIDVSELKSIVHELRTQITDSRNATYDLKGRIQVLESQTKN
jgi:hypothetical protein